MRASTIPFTTTLTALFQCPGVAAAMTRLREDQRAGVALEYQAVEMAGG